MGKRFIFFVALCNFAVGVGAAGTADCSDILRKWTSDHGFRLESSKGNVLYCRDIVVTGSHIRRRQCGTEAELALYANEIDHINLACNEYRR
jgi:hypothetical protein